MSELNQVELYYIRELAQAHQLASVKLENYASECKDTKIKQMLEQASQDAKSGIQKLNQLISN